MGVKMIEKLVKMLETIKAMIKSYKGNTEEMAQLTVKLAEKEKALKKLADTEAKLKLTIAALEEEQQSAIEIIDEIEKELRKY
tara:strand:+ start:82 stop:330 length:249 start_codon:yes stop_codon:yes gene_type:complete